ncbi:type II toxin-antitoxin system RelE/ParE family toxin [Achromobacter sp. LC458]|uniref:type II toxin-antitoxin system RelE/ParE family toxin n=1 Tax=Achromobacter sp. LC458 TaxID=1120623 RepID=UPI00062A2B0E|nr:type II toxin-antitoxin system RelE/ParE family toxin [Achromobacter sp. LC458]TRM54049.1 type II toxin-antitoxin system RelE/ParE family toxin [Achromobacter sp. LC458]
MPVLEWRQTAREDLLAIVEYISDDSPAAALRLLDEIEQKGAKLRRRPRLYRVGRVAGTREMVVKPQNFIALILKCYIIRPPFVMI